jgi:hypothetical protein
MGIRFYSNTWRAPLQLIDSWLPAHPRRSTLAQCVPQVMQRFVRAGWLGRGSDQAASRSFQALPAPRIQPAASPGRTCHLRVVGGGEFGSRSDGRLVISGRMSDVCAELDRLAALEHQGHAMRA